MGGVGFIPYVRTVCVYVCVPYRHHLVGGVIYDATYSLPNNQRLCQWLYLCMRWDAILSHQFDMITRAMFAPVGGGVSAACNQRTKPTHLRHLMALVRVCVCVSVCGDASSGWAFATCSLHRTGYATR